LLLRSDWPDACASAFFFYFSLQKQKFRLRFGQTWQALSRGGMGTLTQVSPGEEINDPKHLATEAGDVNGKMA